MKAARLGILLGLLLCSGVFAPTFNPGGGGGSSSITPVTSFPGSPVVNQIVTIGDDSAVGACDSAGGTAVTICYWTGAVWAAVGDGSGTGAGDISDVWSCASGNCSALTAAAGDSLDAGAADSSRPTTRSTALPGTCLEGQQHQDTDSGGSETYVCTAVNTWTKLVAPTDNVATASALAANGANCSAGSAPLGVDASGAAETCTDYMEEPGSNGIVARTSANTAAARTITGTANQVDVTNGAGTAGNPTLALSSTLTIPGPGIEFTETAGDATCAAGNYWIKANSTTTNFRKCQNGTASDLDTGGAGGIGGATGATDNAVIRADGTGGTTIQSSLVTIDDTGKVVAPGGFESTGGTGTWASLEGTSPGAGASAGIHNLFFNSSDSKLHSHENGGADVTYARTADNLSVFSATTSAELAGVLNNETGTNLAVFNTSPTLTTPTINTPTFGGTAPTLADGVTWTFNPNGTSAGLNIGSQAGLVSTPNNGDIWYDSTANKYKCRENGVTVDCISTGAGTGDVTDVAAGAGIAVATPGGPAPTVSWDASTFVNNVTLWNGANASRTMTLNLSGTDPVWTYSSNTANLSTGVLQVGGSDVATAASTTNFTNKTLDCNGTGNSCKIQVRMPIAVAGCNNATAGPVWDLPTTGAAVPTCVTGTNTQKGVLAFADATSLSFQFHVSISSTWDGGDMTLSGKWYSSATTNSVVWQTRVSCVADAETDDPSWDTDILAITDAAKGTTNQLNDFSGTLAASTHLSTCAAGELMHVQFFRDAGHASDTMTATANLMPMELVYWVTQ
jgi:hypothetical protein